MEERLARDLAIEEDLQIKIKDTLLQKNQYYVQLCALSYEERHKNKIKLTVAYDTGWQNISSGSRYDSSIRHAFIIGGISEGVIGMVLYSKAFQNCDSADNRV